MMIARRELLSQTWGAGALIASALAVRCSGLGQVWIEDRLGLSCQLGADEASARRILAAARAAGFRRAQIGFPWTGVPETYLRALPAWLQQEGIQAEVLGAYVNCCSPETVLSACRRQDLYRAMDLAGALGCRHLAAWTGGYGAHLMEANPRNVRPEAADAICRFLEGYIKRLEAARLTLSLETYITLACPNAPSLKSLLDRLPPCIGAVLDPPNLTPPERYSERDAVLLEMTAMLRARIGVVHLKDFRLRPDGKTYLLPSALDGEMNYPLFAKQILALPGSPPIIAEHLKEDQFGQARRRLLPVFQAASVEANFK